MVDESRTRRLRELAGRIVAELNEIHECGQSEGLSSEDVVLLMLQEYAAVLDTEGDRPEPNMISANPDVKEHASAPVGYRCADCQMDGEACPRCYTVWWQRRHPNTMQLPADTEGDRLEPAEPHVDALIERARDWQQRLFDDEIAGFTPGEREKDAQQIINDLLICVTEWDQPTPPICPSHICPVCYHEKDRCSHCDRPAVAEGHVPPTQEKKR